MIYLASPYTAPTPEGREERFLLVEQATAALIKKHYHVYSPIVHCHVMAEKYGFPTDFQFWLEYNNSFIRRAEAMFILAIPGWKASKGVTAEIALAKLACMSIVFVTVDGDFIDEAIAEDFA